jgi:hypothetical protein
MGLCLVILLNPACDLVLAVVNMLQIVIIVIIVVICNSNSISNISSILFLERTLF